MMADVVKLSAAQHKARVCRCRLCMQPYPRTGSWITRLVLAVALVAGVSRAQGILAQGTLAPGSCQGS